MNAVLASDVQIARLHEIVSDVDRLHEDISRLDSRVDALEPAVGRRLSELQSEIRSATNYAGKRRDETGERLRQLKGRLADLQGQWEQGLTQLTAERNSLGQSLGSLARQLASHRALIVRRQAEIERAQLDLTSQADVSESRLLQTEQATAAGVVTLTGSLAENLNGAATQLQQSCEKRLQTAWDSIAAPALTKCQTELQARAAELSEALNTLQNDTTNKASTALDSFSHQHQQRGAQLTTRTEEMGVTLRDAGKTIESVVTTLVEGGETVNDALQATSVGLRTVIGILENCRKILEEIQNAV